MMDAPAQGMNGTNIILRLNCRLKNIISALKYHFIFLESGTIRPISIHKREDKEKEKALAAANKGPQLSLSNPKLPQCSPTILLR
jgi:hypothetical protein